MEEKKGKSNRVTILLLLIIVILAVALYLSLTGKITLSKNEPAERNNNTTETTTTEETNYTYENIKGLYSYKSETQTDESGNEFNYYYGLYLYENGTFNYRIGTFARFGYIGNYTIVGNEIKLNYLYSYNSGTGLNISKESKTIKIETVHQSFYVFIYFIVSATINKPS